MQNSTPPPIIIIIIIILSVVDLSERYPSPDVKPRGSPGETSPRGGSPGAGGKQGSPRDDEGSDASKSGSDSDSDSDDDDSDEATVRRMRSAVAHVRVSGIEDSG